MLFHSVHSSTSMPSLSFKSALRCIAVASALVSRLCCTTERFHSRHTTTTFTAQTRTASTFTQQLCDVTPETVATDDVEQEVDGVVGNIEFVGHVIEKNERSVGGGVGFVIP